MNPERALYLASTGIDAGYWDGLNDGKLRLPACATCGHWIWPAQPRCSKCLHTELDWRDVDADGVVHSWTRTWYPFVPERADDLPYTVLLVELPHAGSVRVLGVYAGAAEDPVRIGDRVRGIVEGPSPRTFGLPSLTWASAGS
jgi:uncharacterized OB-fold protein